MEKPRIIELPKFLDERGNLSFAENFAQIPFEIKRTYWLYDVPGGECRGGHAYRENQEFIVALSGSFDVILDDGKEKKTFTLTQGNLLYIYMVNKMNDGAMKLRKMGITEEDVESIKEHLDPRLVQLADWLQDEYMTQI